MGGDGARRITLPPEIVKYIAKDAPKDAKMLAAKALVPMAPAIQATVLFFLTGDPDPDIAAAARQTLAGLPAGILRKILVEPLHPKVLHFFAQSRTQEEELLEVILLNNACGDETYAALAAGIQSEKILTIIVNNQSRLMRTPAIAEALRKNPATPKNLVDRTISFLRMNGITLEGESPELTPAEIQQLTETAALGEGEEEEDYFPEELILEGSQEMTEEQRQNITQKIAEMGVAEKVKLALMGNKEARSILIKDPNKVVATSVVKSPRIKENEVIMIAQMRSVNDEVVRIIARNPDWVQLYAVQLALANNPKTPLQVAMRFVRTLRLRDLSDVSKSKNISPTVTKLAKELYMQRREKGGG
jgi:hypothetical protein